MINKLLITISLLLINSTLFAQAVPVLKSKIAPIFKTADFKKQKRIETVQILKMVGLVYTVMIKANSHECHGMACKLYNKQTYYSLKLIKKSIGWYPFLFL